MYFVRVALPEDAWRMQQVYASYVNNSSISFEYTPPDVVAFRQRMQYTMVQFPWLSAVADTCVIGYAYASVAFERPAYQWDADVSVYIDPAYARKGVGRMLYAALHAFLRTQGYVTTYACITAANTASRAFHERSGYMCLGVWPQSGFKHGAWHDIVWYQNRLQTPPTQPQPPVAFSRFSSDDCARIIADAVAGMQTSQ